MGFTLQLTHDLVEADAGTTTPISVIVVNKGGTADRFELELEGIDPEWKAIPVPTFTADPGESHGERIFVKPPRASESLAGNYPFVVKVRSLDSGEQKTAQGVLKVKPYHHLTMEIDPKKGAFSPTVHKNHFIVTLVNLGNTEHTIQLVGSDPEDACTYEFEHEQVTLGAGQQKEVSVHVTPASTRLLSSGRLIGFSVAGRSIDSPSVVATTQAQLEQRSLFSPTTLGIGVLLALIVAVWLFMMPKPPGVQLTINPMHTLAGGDISVAWSAHDANHVVITATTVTGKSEMLYDGPNMSGSLTLKVGDAPMESIVATADKNDRQPESDRKTVAIDPPPPPPEIRSFRADLKRVKVGGAVTFKWEVLNADQVLIAPINVTVPADAGSYQWSPTAAQPGPQEFSLIASTADGKQSSTRGPIKIFVYEESDAQILGFTASPQIVKESDGGKVTLSWQVTKANRVELQQGNLPAQVVGLAGSQDFTIADKTTFLLTALDENKRARTQRVTVLFQKAPPSPPTDTTTTGTADSGTTGSTQTSGGTTGGTAGTASTAATGGNIR